MNSSIKAKLPDGCEIEGDAAGLYLLTLLCLHTLRNASRSGEPDAEPALHYAALAAEKLSKEAALNLMDSLAGAEKPSSLQQLLSAQSVVHLPEGGELRDTVAGFFKVTVLALECLASATLEDQSGANLARYHAALAAVKFFKQTSADALEADLHKLYEWPIVLRADTSRNEVIEILKKLGSQAVPRPASRPPTAPFIRYAHSAFEFILRGLAGGFDPSAELFDGRPPSASDQQLVDAYESIIEKIRLKVPRSADAKEDISRYLVRVDDEYESFWWEAANIFFNARHPDLEKRKEFQGYVCAERTAIALRPFLLGRIKEEFDKLFPR